VNLAGKTVVVTGGASGIGRAIALGLGEAGVAVVVAEVNADRGTETAAEIEARGGQALAVVCDVSDARSVQAMTERAVARFGRLDLLVNNAGVTSSYHVLEMPESEWDRVLGVNLKGVFLCSQAAARVMAPVGRGVIINVSSQLAEVARPNKSHYVTAKGGVRMLTKALALDLAPHGVRVNAVAPGPVETELATPLLEDPTQRAAILSRLPLGRLGQPDDLVGAVIFLASDAARFITGATIVVDGGYLAT
jgi:NAD(P)-dependent dehydrogenase (short-subunit alcohol dehydrogenase family)